MAQIINTNISALNAQRNLNRSQAAGMQAMQRLSSGLRINSAKDDAAGLGISDRMSSQIRGQNQAVRNANDGISMVQTGDGALSEIGTNLQRIRELAVQSSNVTNTASDRAAIDLEVQQRLSEIDRTASTTSFNGQKLLNGSLGTANFQIGANAGETIKLGMTTDVRVAASGKVATTTSGTMGSGAIDGHISSSLTAGASPATFDFSVAGSADTAGTISDTITSFNFSAPANAIDGTSTAQAITNGFNFSTAGSPQVDGTNVDAAVNTNTAFGSNQGTAVTADVSIDYSAAPASSFTVDGQAVTITAADHTADFLTHVNGQLTNITASFDPGAGNVLTFTRTGPANTQAIAITGASAGAIATGINNSAGTGSVNTNFADFSGAGLAQFDVGGQSVTLNTDLSASTAVMAAAIEAQLTGITVDGTTTPGQLTYTRTGSTTAVAITDVDVNAGAAGITASAGTTGTAAVATTNASFTVSGATGGVTAVTLTGNNADYAAILTEVQGDLAADGGKYTAALDGNNDIVFTTVGETTATSITAIDSPAFAAGFRDSAGVAGSAATTTANANLTIGGHAILLDQNFASYDGVAGAIQAQLDAADSGEYTVSNTGAALTIARTSTGASSAAVAIGGLDVGATTAGFTAGAGTAGAASVDSDNANFTIDGKDVALTANYTDRAGVAAAIRTQLGADYSVNTGVGGVNQQSALTAAVDKNYTLAANGPSSFAVDGKTITLNTNLSAVGAALTEINDQLTAGTNSNITASFDANNGDKLTFTRTGVGINGDAIGTAVAITATDTKAQATGLADSNGLTGTTVANQIQISKNGSTTAINITGSDAKAAAAGFGFASGTAGTAGGSVTLDNLTINGTSMAGTYANSQALADKINGDVTGVYASVSSGSLKLTSATELTLGGAEAGTLGGTFTAGVTAANSGSLSTANTLTVDGALDTIQRVDNALSTVTTLRSTLGAVQNRFQSVIANLESTSENLSAARSRIMDADFASESAELSRTQVLQQAGTAMLAQANQSSQGVMALLR